MQIIQQLLDKIPSPDKHLNHQELRAEVLNTLIDVAEKQVEIFIRKTPGNML